jgi:hypothetical protein
MNTSEKYQTVLSDVMAPEQLKLAHRPHIYDPRRAPLTASMYRATIPFSTP